MSQQDSETESKQNSEEQADDSLDLEGLDEVSGGIVQSCPAVEVKKKAPKSPGSVKPGTVGSGH